MLKSLTVSLLGVCDRVGCGKARARNPRTGEFHSFCSLRCSRYESFSQPSVLTATADFTMDLVIALEMSRLQLIEDEVRKQHREQSASSSEVNGGPVNMLHQSEDVQLRLAIHLSLEECQKKGNGIGSSTFPEQQNVSDMPTTSWGNCPSYIRFHRKNISNLDLMQRLVKANIAKAKVILKFRSCIKITSSSRLLWGRNSIRIPPLMALSLLFHSQDEVVQLVTYEWVSSLSV